MAPPNSELPLDLEEFALIARTICSVIAPEQGDHTRACLYYGIGGAFILHQHYGIKARPVVGAALYCVGADKNQKPTVLAFMTPDVEPITSTVDHFHCWIESDEWTLDFTAPYFRETMRAVGLNTDCPRKAFQTLMSQEASSANELREPGDFLHVANPELTQQLVKGFVAVPAQWDLIRLASEWFTRPQGKMRASLTISGARGRLHTAPLLDLELTGTW